MYSAVTLRRLWTVLLLGLVMTATVLLFATTPASAHPCDDNYKEQKDRENCWWRYWNDQQTDEDRRLAALTHTPAATSVLQAEAGGAYCDVHYTTQKDRENCWWRYHNNLPLVLGDKPDALGDEPDNGSQLRRGGGVRHMSPGDKPDNKPNNTTGDLSQDDKPDNKPNSTTGDLSSGDKPDNIKGDLVFVPLTTQEWEDARRRFFGDK